MESKARIFTVRPAETKDLPDIVELLTRYRIDNLTEEERKGGYVSVKDDVPKLQKFLDNDQGIYVAYDSEDVLCGVAMGSTWDFMNESPICQKMREILHEFKCEGEQLTKENSYLYGPICINMERRGGGIGKKLILCQPMVFSGRYKYMINFVDQDNLVSHHFHQKHGFKDLGTFDVNDKKYWMMGYTTDII